MGRKPAGKTLKHALLERLMHYYYYVTEKKAKNDGDAVSSQEIGSFLTMDDTLVRKDLAAIGVRGYPRVGFKAEEVKDAIRNVLGFDHTYKAVIVGAGRMGGALASYTDFSNYGLRVVAAFDLDPNKHGIFIGSTSVQSMENLEPVIEQHNVRLAILTVPAEPAQAIAERLVKAGVQAIWNFAPVTLTLPGDVVVRHEHISVGLAELAYHLKTAQEERLDPDEADASPADTA